MRVRQERFWLAALVVVGLAVSLAGCGAGSGSSTGEKPVPCQGSILANAPTPIVIIRNSDTNHDVSVPVGEVVEIQMDVQHTWQLGEITPADALTRVGAQGVVQNNACVWDFRVARAADVTVTVVGGALCAPNQPCPAYAILAKFTIHGY